MASSMIGTAPSARSDSLGRTYMLYVVDTLQCPSHREMYLVK